MNSFSLKMTNLTKTLNNSPIVNECNLTLKKNKRVALLGLNGAGKSSLIKLLVGESKPNRGEILFSREKKIWHPQDLGFKTLLGYQADTMLSITEMTGREYLIFCASLKKLTPSKIERSLILVTQQWNIENLLDIKMESLSKGNLQKLAIAQAFIGEPQWFFFDEPCQSLDPLEQDRFNHNIKSLDDFELCLFSTHNVNHAIEVADDIILFHQAKIAYHFERNLSKRYLLVCTNSDDQLLSTLKSLIKEFGGKIEVINQQIYQIIDIEPEQIESITTTLAETSYSIDFCLPEFESVMPMFRFLSSGEININNQFSHGMSP